MLNFYSRSLVLYWVPMSVVLVRHGYVGHVEVSGCYRIWHSFGHSIVTHDWIAHFLHMFSSLKFGVLEQKHKKKKKKKNTSIDLWLWCPVTDMDIGHGQADRIHYAMSKIRDTDKDTDCRNFFFTTFLN